MNGDDKYQKHYGQQDGRYSDVLINNNTDARHDQENARKHDGIRPQRNKGGNITNVVIEEKKMIQNIYS